MEGAMVWAHITAGSIALGAMIIAWCSRKGSQWHRLGGKVYVLSMAAALLLATVVAALTQNLFLGLIGLFTAYLLFTGWRIARARNGQQNTLDRLAASAMMLVAVGMAINGIHMLLSGNNLGFVLLVFGFLGGVPALLDWRRNGWPVGRERIVLHLNRMGGASIATVTAVFVVNIQTNPEFIAWLAPSVAISPFIAWHTRQQRA